MTLFSSQTIITSAIFSTLMLSACGGSGSKTTETPAVVVEPPAIVEPVNTDYQALIDSAVSEYLPGIILRVESPKQDFLGSAGLSNLSTVENLETYHQMPTASVEITGYADRNGDADRNLALSRERTDSVKQFFNSSGFQNSSIKTIAYGETRPLHSVQSFESE